MLKKIFLLFTTVVISTVIAWAVSKCIFVEEPVDSLEKESGLKIMTAVAAKSDYGSIEVRWHLEDGKIVLDNAGPLTAKLRQQLRNIDYHAAIVKLTGVGLWPVPGRYFVSSAFGIRKDRLHSGIDIPARYGTPVIAAYPGIVIFAGRSYTGYGNLIVTVDKESGYIILYGHLSKIAVSVGDYVSQGVFIGRVGNTGRSFGPHLHFEVRTALDTPIDPLDFLDLPKNLLISKHKTFNN